MAQTAVITTKDTTPKEESTILLTIHFTGGLEMLFANQRIHTIKLPAVDPSTSQPSTVAYLVRYLCDKLMTDQRKELFVLDGSVRPGILVLINDADWELEGEAEYQVKEGDEIVFVSTLHGG
ncbi:MAG: Ubiquitin- modifier 1 [Bogoriella megaspora]|nr:MAG: Ubiquitin- modifier 1 [Bogoriella megaspora]